MSLAVNSSTAPSTVTTAVPSTASAAAPSTAAASANTTSKVDAQATKIPAIQFVEEMFYPERGPVNVNAIYIPSIGIQCHYLYDEFYANFSNPPETNTVTTSTEIDSMDVPMILELAQRTKQVNEAMRLQQETQAKCKSNTHLKALLSSQTFATRESKFSFAIKESKFSIAAK